MSKKFLALQSILLGAGVVYSWSKVVIQFETFQKMYGTIFRIKDCAYPNPLVTACFYGAVAFLIAFIWSVIVLQSKKVSLKQQTYLRNFLLFGVVFAGSVVTFEFLLYYKIIKTSQPIVACSPGVFPLQTPCFVGMMVFLASFIVAAYIVRSALKEIQPSEVISE